MGQQGGHWHSGACGCTTFVLHCITHQSTVQAAMAAQAAASAWPVSCIRRQYTKRSCQFDRSAHIVAAVSVLFHRRRSISGIHLAPLGLDGAAGGHPAACAAALARVCCCSSLCFWACCSTHSLAICSKRIWHLVVVFARRAVAQQLGEAW